jgi:uncharacterized protein (DUF58 family)
MVSSLKRYISNQWSNVHAISHHKTLFLSPLGILCTSILICILCGIVINPLCLAIVPALGMLVLIGLAYPGYVLRNLNCSVIPETSRSREGDTVNFSVRLISTAWLPALGLTMRGPISDAPVPLPDLGIKGSSEGKVAIENLMRGAYEMSDLSVQCGFPFNLSARSLTVDGGNRVVVWPSFSDAPAAPISCGGQDFIGSEPSHEAGHSGDIMGAREYRRGDSIRRIHWAQTARQGKVIVNERQATRRPTITMLLDLGDTGTTAREQGIRACMSLLEHWSLTGAMLSLVIRDDKFQVISGRIGDFRDALAELPKWNAGCQPPVLLPHLATSPHVAIVKEGITCHQGTEMVICFKEAGWYVA